MEYKYEGYSFKSGIYKIINKFNGRIYIGSAKRFIERWKSHTSSLRTQKHSNKFLQADFNKCGEDAFVFEVVEVTDGKTKEVAGRLKKFGLQKGLLVDVARNDSFDRATRNLPKFRYYGVDGLNVYDLLKYDHVVLTKESVAKIVERCGEGK